MNIEQLATRLCAVSRDNYANPYTELDWPESLDEDAWYMSPELISLYGTDDYAQLDDAQRKRLSFFETLNFFSLSIHGEKYVVEGLSQRLFCGRNATLTDYMQHFLDEENKHIVYFGGFCNRYGKIYPPRTVRVPRDCADAGDEEFLFFTKVLIFEDIVDVYNTYVATDERVAPLARQINHLHHVDEARHLAFGRARVQDLYEKNSPRWSASRRKRIVDYVFAYLESLWREYYNPVSYGDAGLGQPYAVMRRALANPHCRRHRQRMAQRCMSFMQDLDLDWGRDSHV